MAKSRYEYVKAFELQDKLLPDCWIVVRVDGRGFTKFTANNEFVKPNDVRGLDIMNAAASAVMSEYGDIVFAYGHSDEYSFVFRKDTRLYGRRDSKILTAVVSCFTANYIMQWANFFDNPLSAPPLFDGRCVLYPNDTVLRDYMSWRQADCHINNLYNTTFWALIADGSSEKEAHTALKGTVSADKHEILHGFGINYNDEREIFKRGTLLYKAIEAEPEETEETLPDGRYKRGRTKPKYTLAQTHESIIDDDFWQAKPQLGLYVDGSGAGPSL